MDERPLKACELEAAALLKCEFSMLDTARLVETDDAEPREEAESEPVALRLEVAADSDVELRVPAEFVAGEAPREFALVLPFVPPRAADADAEFAEPLRPKLGDEDAPRLAVDAEEPKRALEGGATPARLPAP